MGDKRCLAVSSFGSLKHFKAPNKVDNNLVWILLVLHCIAGRLLALCTLVRTWELAKQQVKYFLTAGKELS